MTIVPESRARRLSFYESRVPMWGVDAPGIGLTDEAVAELAARAASTRAAYKAMQMARNAARSATLRFHEEADGLHAAPGAGADMIAKIKTYAQSTDDPDVYAQAHLPAPAPAGPLPAPGRPYRIEATLLATGALELNWKCDNPRGARGTMYEVRRSIGGAGAQPRTLIATVGVKRFRDETLPSDAGSVPGGVVYTINAVRSTVSGPARTHVVQFGSAGVGAAGGAGAGVKIAA